MVVLLRETQAKTKHQLFPPILHYSSLEEHHESEFQVGAQVCWDVQSFDFPVLIMFLTAKKTCDGASSDTISRIDNFLQPCFIYVTQFENELWKNLPELNKCFPVG